MAHHPSPRFDDRAIRHSGVSAGARVGELVERGGGAKASSCNGAGEIVPPHAAPSRPTPLPPLSAVPPYCGPSPNSAEWPVPHSGGDAHEAPQIASTTATENCGSCYYGCNKRTGSYGTARIRCRRYPPKTDAAQPLAAPDDWCGEYSPKAVAK